MFENLSYLALQQYWWIIISILGSLLVFLMFVQGGQTLVYQIGKTALERSLLLNSIGRKWDLTFTTLVTFGGAFFASFPLFYSTSFSGAYWVWMLILFSFILQAVSYEYRTKKGNFLGEKTFNVFLLVNGVIATLLIGAAVGTFFSGSEFSVDKLRITSLDNPVISQWMNNLHGLEAALNILNLSLGLAIFFLSRTLGSLYFINTIDNDEIYKKSKRQIKINSIPFLIFFLIFITLLFTKQGFAVNSTTKEIYMEPYKYFHNIIAMPIVLIFFLIGVVNVLTAIYLTLYKNTKKGIWLAGIGTVLTVFSIFLLAGFNNTAYYPSTFDLQSSLTIENSSSSHYTLTAMSYVSLVIPFVFAYIWYSWKAMNSNKLSNKDLLDDDFAY